MNSVKLWKRYLRTFSDADYLAFCAAERAEMTETQRNRADAFIERKFQDQKRAACWLVDDHNPVTHIPCAS